jgi:hypothetical protein
VLQIFVPAGAGRAEVLRVAARFGRTGVAEGKARVERCAVLSNFLPYEEARVSGLERPLRAERRLGLALEEADAMLTSLVRVLPARAIRRGLRGAGAEGDAAAVTADALEWRRWAPVIDQVKGPTLSCARLYHPRRRALGGWLERTRRRSARLTPCAFFSWRKCTEFSSTGRDEASSGAGATRFPRALPLTF